MSARRDRIDELLGDRALNGLSEAERHELRALLDEEGVSDDARYELAAASLDLATLGALQPPPANLVAKLQADAQKHFESRRVAVDEVRVTPRPRPKMRAFVPWAIAAAFAAVAAVGWLRDARDRSQRTNETPANVAPPPIAPCPSVSSSATPKSLVEKRADLLARADDVKTLPFTATKDPGGAGATGDVVWSSARQEGYMRFHGLRANDPAKWQYQLWIFDATRDDKFPVDGGVFDVDETTGDVVVPITPKVVADRPKLFAITIERAGGVVVSKREHIVLTAAI